MVGDSSSTLGDGGQRLTEMPAKDMLLVLGSLLAIVLAPIFFILEVAIGGLGLSGLGAVIVDIVIGFLMLVSVGVMRRNRVNGILLALISAVLLIALGGAAGIIGGLFGLVGGLIALATSYKLFLK
ncbi:MAG: hypothetical protein LN412_01205 [Candidatus Thermoplasmatota archaeon]|nr:hypothetical protein [Candidatus Thermoplasmatota archaeon]